MSISDMPLEAIAQSDLRALVANQVTESNTLEYKAELPGNTDEAKREFLADVTALANTAGGILLYGIREQDGAAAEVIGVELSDADAERNRLESIVRDGVAPKVPGVRTHPVKLTTGRLVLVMRIPQSWAAPHMVTFKNWSRFFARMSARKEQLDVGQIRAAFLRSETTAERIRDFRVDRVAKVVGGETPVMLGDLPKLILHLVPLNAFDPAVRFDVAALETDTTQYQNVAPMSTPAFMRRHNFDGYLIYGQTRAGRLPDTYVQVFRSGIIEAVDATALYLRDDDRRIPSMLFEQMVMRALPRYLALQRHLGVEPPIVLILNLVGVKGATMAVDSSRHFALIHTPIDRDVLLVPDQLLLDFEQEPDAALKSSFDTIWNAAGWAGSPNFDKDGHWLGQR